MPAESDIAAPFRSGDARAERDRAAGPAPDSEAVVETIQAFLASFVEELDLPETLRSAIAYSLLGGGKRLRPVLAWASAEAVGGAGPESLPAGAGVELVHAFSLVHDDLPAMDDDDLRRGRPTLHVHAGEALAILAGDAMLTLAYRALERPGPGEAGPPDPGLTLALSRELTTGTTAMIAGQVYDTLGGQDERLTARERLEQIHRNKTAALIRAACRMGAMRVLGRAEDPALDAITSYAEAIGLMFQVVDDLLDVEQTTATLGKRAGKDDAAGKLTYPGLLGVEASRAFALELRDRAIDALAPLGDRAGRLATLCRYLAERTS